MGEEAKQSGEIAPIVGRCLHESPCRWWQHNPNNVGSDLGYGDGWRAGVEFAAIHAPMGTHLLPVSDGRGDDFALAFFDGCTARWCVVHPWAEMQADTRLYGGRRNRCLATWRCRSALRAAIGPPQSGSSTQEAPRA